MKINKIKIKHYGKVPFGECPVCGHKIKGINEKDITINMTRHVDYKHGIKNK